MLLLVLHTVLIRAKNKFSIFFARLTQFIWCHTVSLSTFTKLLLYIFVICCVFTFILCRRRTTMSRRNLCWRKTTHFEQTIKNSAQIESPKIQRNICTILVCVVYVRLWSSIVLWIYGKNVTKMFPQNVQKTQTAAERKQKNNAHSAIQNGK